jgi:hypothetical protein
MHTSNTGTSCISTLTSTGRTCASYRVTWFDDTMASLGAFIPTFSDTLAVIQPYILCIFICMILIINN